MRSGSAEPSSDSGSDRPSSKIDLVVVRRGHNDLHPLCQQRTKTRSRLHHSVPVLGLFMATPVKSAKIIDDAEMSSCGEIGEAQSRPGEPPSMIKQIVEVIEMFGRGSHGAAEDARVRWFAIYQSLAHSLVHQRLDVLAV